MTDSNDKTRALGDEEQERVLRFSTLVPGQVFAGRYKVLSRLGGGGAGEVFRVVDQRTGENHALKVLFPRPDLGPRSAERLKREWSLLRGLDHPGIVQVREIGQVDEIVFLTMECLEGETLRDRLALGGPLDAKEAVRIISEVLAALGAAHSCSIVHRDVKPANIFLRKSGQVVLLDFGLARGIEDAHLTVTGQFIGTPEYVSPEQARGVKDLTPAVDVYSSGIVLWQMLAGQTPYHSDSMIEVLASQLGSPLPPLKTSLRGVEPWLRDAVAWMLEKEPKRRPADGQAAMAILSARRRRPVWKRIRRRPRHLLLAGSALALVAVLLIALLPVEIVRSGRRQLDARSLAGLTVRTWKFETPVVKILEPSGSSRLFGRHRVLFGSRRGGHDPEHLRRYPLNLADISLLGPAVKPVRINPWADWKDGPPTYDKVHHRSWRGEYMARVEHGLEGLDPFLLVYYSHASGDLTEIVLLTPEDRTALVALHPGKIMKSHMFVSGDEGGSKPLLIQFGGNRLLGGRSAVFALPFAGWEIRSPLIATPPRGYGVTARGRPEYYTLLSGSGFRKLMREDSVLVAEPAEGSQVRVDLLSGVPLDEASRGGLTPDAWSRERDELFRLLSSAHRYDLKRELAMELIPQLEEFASQARAQAHVGAALHAATVLAWDAGLASRAADLAKRSIEHEPHIKGHYENLVSLLSRTGRWQEAEKILQRAPTAFREGGTLLERRIAEGLAAGEAEQVESLLPFPKNDDGEISYVILQPQMLLALQRGRPTEALEWYERQQRHKKHPVISMIATFAYLSLEKPDFEKAYQVLARLENNPTNLGMPVDFARDCLSILTGGGEEAIEVPEFPPRPGLDDYTAWALRPWLEALAARTWRELGYEDRALECQRRALALPGAPPRLSRLLEQPEGPR